MGSVCGEPAACTTLSSRCLRGCSSVPSAALPSSPSSPPAGTLLLLACPSEEHRRGRPACPLKSEDGPGCPSCTPTRTAPEDTYWDWVLKHKRQPCCLPVFTPNEHDENSLVDRNNDYDLRSILTSHGLMLVRDSLSQCTSDWTLTITCYILTLTIQPIHLGNGTSF